MGFEACEVATWDGAGRYGEVGGRLRHMEMEFE